MRVSLSQRFVYQSWCKLLVLSYSLSWNSETLSALYDWWPFRMECVKNKWKAGAELWVPSSGKLMHATFNWWLIIIFCSSLIFHIDFFYLQPMIYDLWYISGSCNRLFFLRPYSASRNFLYEFGYFHSKHSWKYKLRFNRINRKLKDE